MKNNSRRKFIARATAASAGAMIAPHLGHGSQQNLEKKEAVDSFSFIFLTDIHYQQERRAAEGFEVAVDKINQLEADFVMTGGDLVFDVLRGNFDRSDSLFSMFSKASKRIKLPMYHCVGNHDLFGIYEESPEDSSHPDYKYGMFQRYFGETYYSFDHKGWHFIVLNALDERDQRYVGIINEPQVEWLKDDLSKVDKDTPIAVTLHIPFLTVYRQVYPPGKPAPVKYVENSDEVLNLFNDHNLKLVLQGHMHWIEDLNVQNKTRFITGGSLAGRPSWRRKDDRGDGKYYNQEGFMHFTIKGEDIDWKYIDIGWKSIEE
ncbi:MAG: metallophosphoesterase [Cyclobacteriaceae bacterium]